MPDFKGVENLNLILAFVVPGLVITAIRNRFITGRPLTNTEILINYVALSALYFGLVAPFLQPLNSLTNFLPKAFAWIVLTIFGPAIVGLLFGVAAQLQLGRKIAHALRLNPVHYIPSAWDWRFWTIRGQFVRVTLSDGTEVYGYFGNRSFASSDPAERDLYLEEEYDFREPGEWTPRKERVGILISGKDIRFVEIWERAER
jgi:hypothetical protein